MLWLVYHLHVVDLFITYVESLLDSSSHHVRVIMPSALLLSHVHVIPYSLVPSDFVIYPLLDVSCHVLPSASDIHPFPLHYHVMDTLLMPRSMSLDHITSFYLAHTCVLTPFHMRWHSLTSVRVSWTHVEEFVSYFMEDKLYFIDGWLLHHDVMWFFYHLMRHSPYFHGHGGLLYGALTFSPREKTTCICTWY